MRTNLTRSERPMGTSLDETRKEIGSVLYIAIYTFVDGSRMFWRFISFAANSELFPSPTLNAKRYIYD